MIRFEKLTKCYPSPNKKLPAKPAVEDLTFEIGDGELLGLLGPSGCGKSTLLNMISGLLQPTEGRIYFDDIDVTDMPTENRGVGMVFQTYALYPHMTVRDNILFPLQNRRGADKLSKEEMEAKVREAAEIVQIENYLDRRPGELSGGQQQRVAIARALVKKPPILLLDEPLSNLDARLRLQTREEIRRIQRTTGITTVFVTHDQDEAMSISDRILVLKDGRLQQADQPQKVYDDPANLFVARFLGLPPINVLEGRVQGGQLFLGDAAVLAADGIRDGQVYAAIRPEGFLLDENGPLECALERVEVLGRDCSIVMKHPACADTMRCIADAGQASAAAGSSVRFSLRPDKVFLFDRESELRLRPEER